MDEITNTQSTCKPPSPELILCVLRCARSRAKLFINEVETVATALKGGAITVDTALDWMDEIGVSVLVPEIGCEAA